MQWQPGADLKGVTTVYPDIIPQYIPFDYDKLAAVKSAEAKAKTAAKAKAPSTTPFTSAIEKLITDVKLPSTLIVGVDESTGALIEAPNDAKAEWNKWLMTLESDIAPKVQEDPSIIPSIIAYMGRVKSQFLGLSDAMSSTNELAKNYKESNKSGLYDLINENSRYLEAVKSGGDLFSYGQTSVFTPVNIREQMHERFKQMPTEEREVFEQWRGVVAPLGEQLYLMPKTSVEYKTQEKLENSFNSMVGSEDFQNQLKRETNLKIHNYSLQWNNKSKADKDAANTMLDSEYNEKLTKLGNLQSNLAKLKENPDKNKNTIELLTKEYNTLQNELYGGTGNIIVNSKGELAKDLMADQIYKMKIVNLFKEFIGSGSYSVDKRGVDVAASFYLSDFIRKNSEKKKDDSDSGVFSQPIILDSDVPFNPLEAAAIAVEKSDSDGLYNSMPSFVTQTRAALNVNGVLPEIIKKLEQSPISASSAWKSSVIDIFKNNPQTLATLLAVQQVHKKSKNLFQSKLDPLLKTYAIQNASSVIKESSIDRVLEWLQLASLDYTMTSPANRPDLAHPTPSLYDKTLKQIEKDQTLMPNSLLFTASRTSDNDPMRAMINIMKSLTGSNSEAFLLENGINLKMQTTHLDDDKNIVRKYDPVNNGTFGEDGYYQLMADISNRAKSNADNNKHARLFGALSVLGNSNSRSRILSGIITSLPNLMSQNASNVTITKEGSPIPVTISFSSGNAGKILTINYRGNKIEKLVQTHEDALAEIAYAITPSLQ